MERANARPENISRAIYAQAALYMMPPAIKKDIDEYLERNGYTTYSEHILEAWRDDP